MPKVKIQLAVLGHLPPDFDVRDLGLWRSKAFEISPEVESYQLTEDAHGPDWEFTDAQFEGCIRRDPKCSLLIVFVSVKLENNWYLRRLSDDRLVFTFYELDQILRFQGLPLKNLALRVIYAAVLVYKRYKDRIPTASEKTDYAHDETRGCLFDMNANKLDVVRSLHQPRLCESCVSHLKQTQVSNELLDVIQNELLWIKKPLADRIVSFVRAHTVLSIVLSILSAIVLGTAASLLASFIYDALRTAT